LHLEVAVTRIGLVFIILLGWTQSSWATLVFINDAAGFNAAIAGYGLLGTENFESSTLGAGMITSFNDPLAPGVANSPFPSGTNPATGLTVQSNTLGGSPTTVSPRGFGGLATASAGYAGTPTDQISSNFPGDSFDMRFGLTSTTAVSFTPLVFTTTSDPAAAGTANLRVYDKMNALIASMDNIPVAVYTNPTTVIGIVAMTGEDIGRINLFTTSYGTSTTTSDFVAGADDVSVFAAIPETSSYLFLGTVGSVVIGYRLVTKRRRITL
jgi:hypothetical protein